MTILSWVILMVPKNGKMNVDDNDDLCIIWKTIRVDNENVPQCHHLKTCLLTNTCLLLAKYDDKQHDTDRRWWKCTFSDCYTWSIALHIRMYYVTTDICKGGTFVSHAVWPTALDIASLSLGPAFLSRNTNSWHAETMHHKHSCLLTWHFDTFHIMAIFGSMSSQRQTP